MRIIPFILFFVVTNLSAQVFVIQRGDEVILHDNVNDAFNGLEENDELYLPGGTYTLTENFFGSPCSNGGLNPIGVLPDNVKVFGAGHYPEYTEVTGKTIINEYVGDCGISDKNGVLKLGNSNILTGVQFNFRVLLQNNASVSYCNLHHIFAEGADAVTNVHITSNIINPESLSSSGFGKTGMVTKNIIGGKIVTGNSGILFNSNIFLDTTNYSFLNGELISGIDAIFQNNIFVTEHTHATSLGYDVTHIYTNNLFVGDNPITGNPMPGSWAYEFITNNTFYQDPNIMFESYVWGSLFDYGFDFHLSDSSAGIGADTNGENIGIFKMDDETENKIPFNPHFISKMIPSESDGSGFLNIQIEVEARQN